MHEQSVEPRDLELIHCLERFELLGRLSPESIIVHRNNRIIYANRSSLDLLGAPGIEEILGRSIDSFVAPEEIDRVERRRRRIGESDDPSPDEFELVGLDGVRRTAHVTSGWIKYDNQPARLVVARDVTDELEAQSQRARLKAQLDVARRLEAIGRLAGGIAHDFNNLLTVIAGHTRLALETMDEDDPLRANLVQVDYAAERAASLTRQLLAFGRRQVLRPSLISINSIVLDMEKMLRRLIGEDVTLVLDLRPDLCAVRADRGQIEQVIVNLVMNARDAMPAGGTIEIATDVAPSAPFLPGRDSEPPPGCHARLSVRDHGEGMDRETVERIFEPFFSTKSTGRGTGLGLATVYGIVSQSRGSIEVDTEPGSGAVFRIYLPAADPDRTVDSSANGLAAEVDVDESAGLRPASARARTILFVEDDPNIRELGLSILTNDGYRVLSAGNAEEALRIARDEAEPVHLLLTDVVLPGVDGVRLSELVKQDRPEIGVLFISGYPEEKIDQLGSPEGSVELLEKPFTPQMLLRRVSELIRD